MNSEEVILFAYILSIIILMTLLVCIFFKEREKKLNKKFKVIIDEKTKELEKIQFKKINDVSSLVDLGKLSAGLAHDIREPLTIISLILQKAEKNNNVVTDLRQAFLEIDKIDELSRMSVCKLSDEPQNDYFNLNLEIKKLMNLFEYESRIKKTKIIFESNKEYELYSDRIKLNQVLYNLILNALESYKDSEIKQRFVFIKLIRKPRNLFIRIKDYGVGISDDNLVHIFEPGFSLKTKETALGFGLYLSQELMKKTYCSKIRVESKFGVGSTFSLAIKKRFVMNEIKPKK